MTVSSSAVINAVLTNLGSASVLGNYVDTDYYILERSSTCAAIIGLRGSNYVPSAFGDPMSGRITYTVLIEGYIRDVNNPEQAMESIAGFSDLIMTSLISDDTLQNSVDTITSIEMRRNQNEAVSAGGHTWLPIYIDVQGYKLT